MVQIHQSFIPQGRRNRPGRTSRMEFITIHNTGNPSVGAGASNHARYLQGNAAAGLPVSWHYTIDGREIFQHLPDNEDAFHAGDGGGNGNRHSIGLEIAENSDGDLRRATDNAVWLTALLCVRHNIPTANIRQHHDWSSRAGCPARLRQNRPYSWAQFIANVTAEIERQRQPAPTPETSETLFRVQIGAFRVRANAEQALQRAEAAGFTDAFILEG